MSVMEQSIYEDSVCDAIDIIVGEAVNSAGYDKTISALVVECLDDLTGKYKVKYQDAFYYATSDNVEVSYSSNTQVYILVPQGDFSREKKIIGTVKDLGDAYVNTWQAENEYLVVGKNCASLSNPPVGLCSYKHDKYKSEDLILYKKGASNNRLSIDQEQLKGYILDSEKIRIGATFTTALNSEQRYQGDYGISLKAHFTQEGTTSLVERTFNLGVDNMVGMPYDFGNPTAQYLDFDIVSKNFVEIVEVSLIIKDFPHSATDKANDIFISDIIIQGMAAPSAKVFNTYYLNIITPAGTEVTENNLSKVTLQAELSLKNKVITSSSLEYYWFIEDASVTTAHDRYCSYGGQGWNCLNTKQEIKETITNADGEEEEKISYKWVPGSNIWEVKEEKVPNLKTLYKCVCLYNRGASIEETVEIKNKTADYDFGLTSTNGVEFILDRGKTTLKLLDNSKEKDADKIPSTDLIYHWAKVDSSGGYHYLGSDNTGNGGELPVSSNFDNSQLMHLLKTLKEIYAEHLGTNLVTTKSVYYETTTFAPKEGDTTPVSKLKNTDLGADDDTIKSNLNKLTAVVGLTTSNTNQEFYDAIKKYIEETSITYINEHTFYDIPIRSIVNFNTFKCSVKNTNGDLLGTSNIKITNEHVKNDNGYIIIENGNQTFKYNAEGRSPTNKNNKDPLVIKPLSFKLYDEKGNEVNLDSIPDEDISWYYPVDSTLLEISGETAADDIVDEAQGIRHGKTFIYDIASLFRHGSSNNVIRIEVKYQDRVIKEDTSFAFVKDGMSGTNGTDFYCRIVPKYDLDNAYPTLVYNKNDKKKSLFLNRPEFTLSDNTEWFTVELWNSGVLVTENVSATYSILHTGFSMPTGSYSVLNINGNNFSFDKNKIDELDKNIEHANGFLNIVRAEVTYQGKKYYAELPIALAVIDSETNDYGIYIKPQTGYNEVVYAADGARPKYANAYPFEVQVILFEEETVDDKNTKIITEVDLSSTLNNDKYKTTLKYDYKTLEKEKYLTYAGANNKYFTITKLKESQKDEDGNEILDDEGQVTMIDIEGPCRIVEPSPYYNGAATDLGLKCIVKNRENELIGTLYFPIHFMLNKYGYSALNDWDGNSIDINNEGGYILAPQMGAGVKDSNNRFTGVLMGEMDSGHEGDETDIGLLGFHEGERTIFLDAETGKAEFGKAGAGQIILDPTKTDTKGRPLARIYSGNYYTDATKIGTIDEQTKGEGMLIDFTTPEIRYGNGKFAVTSEGKLIAREADVRGPISSSSVNLYGNGYSDFEQIPPIQPIKENDDTADGKVIGTLNEIYYSNSTLSSGSSADVVEGYGRSESKCLKITNGESGNKEVYFLIGSENRNYGRIAIEECKDDEVYIISAHVKAVNKNANFDMYVVEAKGTNETAEIRIVDSNHLGSTPIEQNKWTRVSFEYIPKDFSTYRYIGLRFDNDTPGSSIYVDDVQIEKSYTGLEPNDYHPTGVTKIDGGNITTETITALGRVTAGEFYIGDKDGDTLFQVDSDGYLYAQGAKFEGHIESGSGEIGGWNIAEKRLYGINEATINKSTKLVSLYKYDYNNNHNAFAVWGRTSPSTEDNWSKKFAVDYDGNMFAKSGEIGGWNIESDRLWSESGGKYTRIQNTSRDYALLIGGNHETNIGEAPFRVHHDGTLTATEAKITGAITATSLNLSDFDVAFQDDIITDISKMTGYDNVIKKGDITQSTKTDSNGLSYVETVVPSSNGATIKYQTYSADNYIVFGREKGDKFKIDKDGLLTAKNAIIYGKIYATDGEFAGELKSPTGTFGDWTIGTGRIWAKKDDTYTVLQSQHTYAIRIGATALTSGTAAFTVKHDGTLNIGNGQFTVSPAGKITAKSGTFEGELDGASGSFTSLEAGSGNNKITIIGNKGADNYIKIGNCKFEPDRIKIDTSDSNVGSLIISGPGVDGWKDITLRPSKDDKGNIGTDNYYWNLIRVTNYPSGSERYLKENIQTYNTEQAYEELKDIPFYSYKFISEDNTRLKIGTMIDYMPSETIFNDESVSRRSYDTQNLIFWDIAATQVIQQKLEETIQEKEELQNRLDILEQKFLEMEEKLNGIN